MMPLTVQALIEATGGRLCRGRMDQEVTHISIDSRTIKEGALFFPLVGEKHNGHDFLKQALLKGAVGSFFSPAFCREDNLPPGDKIFIEVPDTLRALQDVARFHRKRLQAKVIAVTGSTGKTTSKDLIHAVLSQKYLSLKNRGNLNNQIGLPLTLLELTARHEVAVLEMAMRAPGEISFLTFLADPQMAVITNIGESHLEILESKERIARAKGELIYWLDKDGIALLNGDDPFCRRLALLTEAKTVFFGFSEECHFRAEKEVKLNKDSTDFTVCFPGGEREKFSVPLPGRHHVYNALAAVAVGALLEIDFLSMKEGLKNARVTGMRTEILRSAKGFEIISDVYNASPSSMRAALEVLAGFEGRPLIAVLGDMLELGARSALFHQEIGAEAAAKGLDHLVLTGAFCDHYQKGALTGGMSPDKIFRCKDLTEIKQILSKIISPGAVVLVKGSRALQLEHVVKHLLQ
ncbi:MAG: UDP-N-acetylmuramoyl-tripeptide--D-alanyl-D-alanine ligase [Firmicutes bacterium]|nr:UDP-N-acetylmuramoyl-tripeptide--D-alanyl-D-alanine ligase [Bacillota bacterium]